jgi:hypothetical protein
LMELEVMFSAQHNFQGNCMIAGVPFRLDLSRDGRS